MSIPPKIPPRLPAIEAQVKEAEAHLAGLQSQTPGLALARAERQPGANKAYTDHQASVTAATADLNDKIAAAEQAAELDRKAAMARIELLRNADPDDLMEGLSVTDCCDGCSDTECMLGPGVGRCCHPGKGGLAPEHFNDQFLRRLQSAAREEIAALERGDYDDEETEEEAA